MTPEQDQDDGAEILRVTVPPELTGQRLDKVVAQLCPDFSRSRLQGLIEAGELYLNDLPCAVAAKKVKAGDKIFIALPDLEDGTPQPENIPLDIVYEDDDVIVLNKAAGMVVHPAVGNPAGTLVNALLYHCGDSLSGINGVKRPGIVHRLDKDTSGLMIVAKNDKAHHKLTEQLQDRSLSRVYRAIVIGVPHPSKGTIETLIGRHPGNRLKQAVVHGNGRIAITHFQVKQAFHDTLSLVECRLATGRTHQIRVHMEHKGFPLIGDSLYGMQETALQARLRKGGYDPEAIAAIQAFPRQALHALQLAFIHPATGEKMEFASELPDDFMNIINIIEDN